MKKNDRLVIGYIHPDFVRAEFMRSMLLTQKKSKTPIDAILSIKSGPLIASARNDICSMFLNEHQADWLLMVDSDMVWVPEAVDKLVQTASERSLPVLGALCFTELLDDNGDNQSTAYELVVRNGQAQFAAYQKYPDNDVFPVAGTGAAFLLVHRDALIKIASGWGDNKDTIWPWFRESTMNGRRVGEDLSFCLRARSAGVPVNVHTGVRVGHIKSHMLGMSEVL
jgi:hypothetical protein